MKVLVTGGAGFLGSALTRRLVADGHSVTVLDDLSTGDPARLPPNARFCRGDVRDIPSLWSLLVDVQVVYHLAARVSVPASVLYPAEYNAVNTGGTVSVMTAARDAGVRRVVLASSGTVYGEQAEQPIAETAWPHPASPYAVSKLAAEGYVRAMGQLYHIETVILRIFNAYGPGQMALTAHPPVVPAFATQILTGGSLILHGVPPGAQTRDFVYVDDVAEALAQAGTLPGISGGLYNIGSGSEVSIRSLVELLEQVTGRQAQCVSSGQSGGVARMCADVSLAAAELGWRPSIPLTTGLARTVEYLKRTYAH